ncbi:hypothetical protein G9A89_000680 [Geosiphon pyriformis]|nr:hypothetical protein G9A89_000680 [Geosiphon pyriformis]
MPADNSLIAWFQQSIETLSFFYEIIKSFAVLAMAPFFNIWEKYKQQCFGTKENGTSATIKAHELELQLESCFDDHPNHKDFVEKSKNV